MPTHFLESGECGELACCWRAGLEGTDSLAGDCDPGIIGLPRLRPCCDCLCLVALFRDALLFVRGQTDSSARFMKDIGDWITIVWELGSLRRDHLSCYAALSFCLDVWQIKGLETFIEPRWANEILSLHCVCVRGTPVGVIAPVEAEILVIGPSDRVGGSMGRSEWLLLVSRWACYGVIKLARTVLPSSATAQLGSGIKVAH